MTKLGLFLAQRLVNKAELARKTGISQNRIHNLTIVEKSHLKGEELYFICLALKIEPNELIQYLYGDKKLIE